MQIKVITPDKQIFEGEISQAKFPGTTGGFEILKSHAPLISTLGRGEILLTTIKEGKKTFQIDGGVVEVLQDNIIVLVEKIIA